MSSMLEYPRTYRLQLTDDKGQRINTCSSKGIRENKDLKCDVIGCHGLSYSCQRHRHDGGDEDQLAAEPAGDGRHCNIRVVGLGQRSKK